MSSQVREMITGITGFRPDGEVSGSYYQAAAGLLPGSSEMCAAVLAYVSSEVQDVSIACGLFGNLDSRGFAGWEIGVNNLGQPYASYGDGASIITIVGGELEPARWALIVLSLDVQNNRFALFVNGQLQAESVVALNALVPSAGHVRVGASSNTSGPYTWSQLIAGCSYLDNSSVLDTEVVGYWEQTRRSGQVIPRNDAFFISPTFQNVWQSALYNDGLHPPVGATKSDAAALWAPAVGTLALTQVTAAGVLQVTQTSSEWSSVDGGGAGPGPSQELRVTNTIFVDAGTLVPTAQQDGSFSRPYKSLQRGVNAVPAAVSSADAQICWNVDCAPTLYDEDVNVNLTQRTIAIIAPPGFRLGERGGARRNLTISGDVSAFDGVHPSFALVAPAAATDPSNNFYNNTRLEKPFIHGRLLLSVTGAAADCYVRCDAVIDGSDGTQTGVSIDATAATAANGIYLTLQGAMVVGTVVDPGSLLALANCRYTHFSGGVQCWTLGPQPPVRCIFGGSITMTFAAAAAFPWVECSCLATTPAITLPAGSSQAVWDAATCASFKSKGATFPTAVPRTLNATCPVAAVADAPTGLRVTWASATTLGVAAGTAQADAGTLDNMTLKAAVVVNMAVNGALGLDTGAFAAAKMYYLYLLQGTSGQTVVASLSSTWAGVTKPAAYAVSGRRIGSAPTKAAAAQFIKFQQTGTAAERSVWFYEDNAARNVLTGGNATALTAVVCTNMLPVSAVLANVQMQVVSGAVGAASISTGIGADGFSASAVSAGGVGATDTMTATIPVTNTPATAFSYAVDAATSSGSIKLNGYTETI